MDFLKNLSLNDNDEKKKKEEEQKRTPAPAPVVPQKESIFDKIGDAFEGHKSTPPPATVATEKQHDTVKPEQTTHASSFLHSLTGHADAPAPVVVAQPPPEPEHHTLLAKFTGQDHHAPVGPAPVPVSLPPKEEGLFARLSEAINPTPPPPPPPAVPVHQSVLGQIFGGAHDATPPPVPVQESLLDRVSSHLSHQAPPPAPAKEDSFLDRLTGRKTPPPAEKEQNLLERVGSHLTGRKTPEPVRSQGVGGRVNSLLGGGHSSEEKEDGLDKALDFVQEHILKKGDQRNESFWEQQTDEQITDAIRRQYKSMTGHEFPIPDKK